MKGDFFSLKAALETLQMLLNNFRFESLVKMQRSRAAGAFGH